MPSRNKISFDDRIIRGRLESLLYQPHLSVSIATDREHRPLKVLIWTPGTARAESTAEASPDLRHFLCGRGAFGLAALQSADGVSPPCNAEPKIASRKDRWAMA